MLIALVLRFDLMMSYGSITGPVLSCASLFCMLLYFVTTVDSGRWVLSNSKVSLSDDVIFFKSHTWQPGFRLPCKQWPNIHLAPSASSLVCNCWGKDYISIVFPFFYFCKLVWFVSQVMASALLLAGGTTGLAALQSLSIAMGIFRRVLSLTFWNAKVRSTLCW